MIVVDTATIGATRRRIRSARCRAPRCSTCRRSTSSAPAGTGSAHEPLATAVALRGPRSPSSWSWRSPRRPGCTASPTTGRSCCPRRSARSRPPCAFVIAAPVARCCRARRSPSPSACSWSVASSTVSVLAAGEVPSPSSFGDFFDGLIRTWADLLSAVSPADLTPRLSVAPYAIAWFGAIVGCSLLRWSPLPTAARVRPARRGSALTVLLTDEDRALSILVGAAIAVGALLLGFLLDPRRTASAVGAVRPARSTDRDVDGDHHVDRAPRADHPCRAGDRCRRRARAARRPPPPARRGATNGTTCAIRSSRRGTRSRCPARSCS